MNEDAFARRFYADRAELESLGISLQVEKPAEGFFEAELYALPPENYYLPAIEFSDSELAALRTALGLLDGEFAYAEPLRLALQQVSWGRPSPLTEEDEAPIDVKLSTAGSGRELSQRLAKIETAISRRKTIEFSYYSLQRDDDSDRKVNPYHLVFRDGPVLFDRPLARARGGAGLPALADPRQGLLRDQGRARLPAARGLRPPRLRLARRLADGRDQGHREGLPARADRLAGRARLRPPRRRCASPQRGDGAQGPRDGLRDRVRLRSPADLLGALVARERAPARPARARRRGRRAPGAAARPPPRRVRGRRRRSSGRSPRAPTVAATAARAGPTGAPSR